MKGFEVEGRTVNVDISTPKSSERAPIENTIFVANLNFDLTKEDVIKKVNDILGEGKVNKVRFSIDRNTNRPRGFGYIDFTDAETASRALVELNGVEIEGRPIRVDKPTPRESYTRDDRPSMGERPMRRETGSSTIFLGNLSWDVTPELLEDMLNDLLGPNQFQRVRMSTDKETGRMKGFAHVDFLDEATAERAVTELNGIELLGRQLRVDHAKRADDRVGGDRRDGGRARSETW